MTTLDKIIYDVKTKKPVVIDLDDIVKGRALFQANSRGGKSYLLRKFVEESNGKIQQIIIDPEGEFSTLREKFNFLLVGKENADIQIDTRHAELLAKKLMETRADAILDLYEMSPFERIRFVKVFLDALVNLPKKLWHPCLVIIDEIHTFAPESSKGRSESLEAVASLASRGGKRGYALIGATQKLSKFHKDVASELNTKFTGRCTLDIDQKRASAELGLKNYRELRELKHEFFVFGPEIEGTIKVKCYPVKTTHEDIGSAVSTKLANPSKIKSMMKDFEELPQEAENELRTTQDLQKKIQEQKQIISQLQRQQPKQDPQAIQKSYENGYLKGQKDSESVIRQYQNFIKNSKVSIAKLFASSETILKSYDDILITQPDTVKHPVTERIVTQKTVTPDAQSSVTNDTVYDATEQPLGRCEKAILETLVPIYPNSMSREEVGQQTNYSSTSGGFSNAISKLKTLGLIEASDGQLKASEEMFP